MEKPYFNKVHNVYDFDKTIYAGDSSIDFYLFVVMKRPKLLKYLPYQIFHWLLYILKIEKKSDFKGNYFIFIKELSPLDLYVHDFWDHKSKKIQKWYLNNKSKNDVVVSASPLFLLKEITQRLEVNFLIATEINLSTGKLIGNNCYGEEKLIRLQEEIPGIIVKEAYSDSYSDYPILDLAEKAYIVRGDKLIDYNKRK